MTESPSLKRTNKAQILPLPFHKLAQNHLCISVFLFVLICVPATAQAAILYLDPPQANVYQNEIFPVEIRIDPEGECVNAVEAEINFPAEALEFVDFSAGNSILSLWAQEPKISVDLCGENKNLCGSVSFSGGVPGGYCGKIQGDVGESNLIGKIFFRAKGESERVSDPPPAGGGSDTLKFNQESTQVLLHDGLGTPAKLTLAGAEINFSGSAAPEKNQWLEELKNDKIPPEPFSIELAQDPGIFDGKYFIAFSTTDKQTGIDHYEVREAPSSKFLFTKKSLNAQSPYLLRDQSLCSIIIVRAVDKAGNERIETIPPRCEKGQWGWLVCVALFFVSGIVVIMVKYKRNKWKHYRNTLASLVKHSRNK